MQLSLLDYTRRTVMVGVGTCRGRFKGTIPVCAVRKQYSKPRNVITLVYNNVRRETTVGVCFILVTVYCTQLCLLAELRLCQNPVLCVRTDFRQSVVSTTKLPVSGPAMVHTGFIVPTIVELQQPFHFYRYVELHKQEISRLFVLFCVTT